MTEIMVGMAVLPFAVMAGLYLLIKLGMRLVDRGIRKTRAAECLDCGRDYSGFGLDTVLTQKQWLMIHPEGFHGLLCASCIVTRASALPGVIRADLWLVSVTQASIAEHSYRDRDIERRAL